LKNKPISDLTSSVNDNINKSGSFKKVEFKEDINNQSSIESLQIKQKSFQKRRSSISLFEKESSLDSEEKAEIKRQEMTELLNKKKNISGTIMRKFDMRNQLRNRMLEDYQKYLD